MVETSCSGALAPRYSDAPSARTRTSITNSAPWEPSQKCRNGALSQAGRQAGWLAGWLAG